MIVATQLSNALTSDKRFANQIGWSDVTPYEIVRVISGRTLEVRQMFAYRDESWTPDFRPGGFCGTVINQNEQRWKYAIDHTRPIIRIRLGKRGWKDARGNKYELATQPRRFYDYNF